MPVVQSASSMALARVVCCSRSLLKESSKAAFCAISHPVWTEGCVGAKRHLLSEDVIKLQDFQQRKLAVAHLVTGFNGNYIDFFHQKLQRNELVLRDELKLLLHLCQSAEDMVIARDAMLRYHSENHNLASGDFKFGPLFMRLCYELGLEDFAAATLKDTKLKGFFNDPTSFNIAIDMLFTKGQYEAALEVLTAMRSQGIQFNKDTLTLAFGTCYKLNNKESYKICASLIEEVQSKGHFIPRHAYCFAVALALRQNDIENAQALYLQIMSTDSRLCQNLRVAMLAMAGGVSEALSVLSAAIVPKGPSFVRRPEFSQELVDLLRLRCEGQSSIENLESIVTRLGRTNQLTQETVDDMLCRTPSGKRRPVIEERKTSRRTLRLLQSSLLTE